MEGLWSENGIAESVINQVLGDKSGLVLNIPRVCAWLHRFVTWSAIVGGEASQLDGASSVAISE